MDLSMLSDMLYQLKIANQELTAAFEKETGFSLTRYQLLHVLHAQTRCTQNQLQAALRIDSAAVTRHLKILEDKGFVTRSRNKDNNREIFVALTAKAIDDLAACNDKHAKDQEGLGIRLTASEAQQLQGLLTKLIQ